MSTWASRFDAASPAPCNSSVPTVEVERDSSYAVLDASALIGISEAYRLADKSITTPEVYNEVRDKRSRQALESLPFGIEQKEPSQEAIAAVTSLAKATGDVHSLSAADIRLIALAYMLHTDRYGKDSLRKQAAPARKVGNAKRTGRALPGWGTMGGEWAEMDKLNQEQLQAQEGPTSNSKVNSQVQELHLEDRLSLTEATTTGSEVDEELSGQNLPSAPAGEEDEWEKATVSHGAARRQRKKQLKQQQKAMQSFEPEHPHSEEDEQRCDASSSSGEDPGAEAREQEEEDGQSLAGPETDASICIATADFAMQNVILQMGLRLVSPDGRQIKRISKWVLRCSACFKVTKEMQRLFCPTCGNAALEKVEVVIGKDGAEVYGVRKRHIIRGTRFSLPKPKGGKNSSDPILREDVYMQRIPKRKVKKEETDPFAPEYSSNTWHDPRYSQTVNHKGVAAALASWKHNPNERQHSRTNRR